MTAEQISALVNLGSAGAVIIVVTIFLRSIKERDAEWRSFFTAINSSSRESIAAMRMTAEKMDSQLEEIVRLIGAHDIQAKQIASVVAGIKDDLDRLVPRTSRRAVK